MSWFCSGFQFHFKLHIKLKAFSTDTCWAVHQPIFIFILICCFAACNWCWFGYQQRETAERRKIYCLLVRRKRSSVCRPLIADICCDMSHALKACIHHHPSFGVNLKVAAVWMSTCYTCGHFQMPALFIQQLWSRTDKEADKEGKTLADQVFMWSQENLRKSSQQGRACFIHGDEVRVWGKGMICCWIDPLIENEWMAAAGSIALLWKGCLCGLCAAAGRRGPAHNHIPDRRRCWMGNGETRSPASAMVRYLHVSGSWAVKTTHSHGDKSFSLTSLSVIRNHVPRPAQPIRRLAPRLPVMIFLAAQQHWPLVGFQVLVNASAFLIRWESIFN